MTWQPGACIAVYGPDGTTTRPYSLSGGVGDPYSELLIRRIDQGAVSSWLADLTPGQRCEVSPPFGWFHPGEPEGVSRVFAATCSGIAPFLSAIRSGASFPEKVLWGLRSADDVVFVEEIPNLEVFVSQGDLGRWLGVRLNQALSPDLLTPSYHVYACGVDVMIEEVMRWAELQGVPEDHLHRECFFTAP